MTAQHNVQSQGAWGSGSPNQYRLVAKPFLDRGMAVAVVGYRLYPNADVSAQVLDLELAATQLSNRYPDLCLGSSELGVTAIGHSSGAHILGMMLLERLRRRMESSRWGFNLQANKQTMRIDSVVGISGMYDIARHFQFEVSNQLENLSPMMPACGGRHQFDRHSPALEVSRYLSLCTQEEVRRIDSKFPNLALVHGLEDGSVPTDSSQRAAQQLRSAGITKCEEFYHAGIGHTESIFELMFGGHIKDTVLDWIEEKSRQRPLA